jgi:hypothetical protein
VARIGRAVKSLKQLRLATFNARVEAVTDQAGLPRTIQEQALPHDGIGLLRVTRYAAGQAALVFHGA